MLHRPGAFCPASPGLQCEGHPVWPCLGLPFTSAPFRSLPEPCLAFHPGDAVKRISGVLITSIIMPLEKQEKPGWDADEKRPKQRKCLSCQ